MALEEYKIQFIETALQAQALKFGSFELKSKRISPHFFKADCFNTGYLLKAAGDAYADALIKNDIQFDTVFGPAYKGIPLATTVVTSLASKGMDTTFSGDRKEIKDHGDGGDFIGAKPDQRCIIVDDVITSGKSIKGSIDFIKKYGGSICGAIVMVDRQERGLTSELSAIQEIEQENGFKVHSIITLQDILDYTQENPAYNQYTPEIQKYREQYGVI